MSQARPLAGNADPFEKRDRFPVAEPCQRRGEKVGRAADFLQEFLRPPHVGQVAAAFAGDPDFPLRLFHLFADQDAESGLCGYSRSHDPGGPSARYDKVEIPQFRKIFHKDKNFGVFLSGSRKNP